MSCNKAKSAKFPVFPVRSLIDFDIGLVKVSMISLCFLGPAV